MGTKISLVVVQDQVGRILLLRRSATDRWMPNKLALPGGHVNFFESHENGAKRELKEETDLDTKRDLVLVDDQGKTKIWLYKHRSWEQKPSLHKASHGFEHSEMVWLFPERILGRDDVVPELKAWKKLMYLEKF
jgi:8-oxo-dGTP pyrophosphatase MutT (NUDIX family)